jgi:hypothetical protein
MIEVFRLLKRVVLAIGVILASGSYGGGSAPAAIPATGVVNHESATRLARGVADKVIARHATKAPPHLGTTGKDARRTSAPPRLGTTGRKHGSGLDWGVGSGAGSTGQRGPTRR